MKSYAVNRIRATMWLPDDCNDIDWGGKPAPVTRKRKPSRNSKPATMNSTQVRSTDRQVSRAGIVRA